MCYWRLPMPEPTEDLCLCGHPASEHGQERKFYYCDDSHREVCLLCPGYEEPGYPKGEAWHRYRLYPGLSSE